MHSRQGTIGERWGMKLAGAKLESCLYVTLKSLIFYPIRVGTPLKGYIPVGDTVKLEFRRDHSGGRMKN